ncbi:MAG TPA: hypothetical protein VM754_08990 [Actinomycetota bacterium]|nr:hypothetical protein [Actinomycetota bacterium]
MPEPKDVIKLVDQTGDVIEELENARLKSFDQILNAPGGCEFEIDVLDLKAGLLVEPLTYEIQVWRHEQLLDWFAPFRPIPDAGQLSVGCMGLLGYFDFRFVDADLTYNGLDQFTIGWNLLHYAQTFHPGAGLNISPSGFIGSGVLRDRSYSRDEGGNILHKLELFTGLIQGFDYSIEVFPDGRREWTPYYPMKGTVRSNLTLEWGRNIRSFSLPRDGTRKANYVISKGAGEGPDKLQQTWFDQPSIDSSVLMMDVTSDESVTELPTLLEKAKAQVAARHKTVVLPTITVGDDPVPTIGVIKTGDMVPVKIDRGAAQLSGLHRVVSISYDPERDEQTLTLNEVPE